MILLHIAMLMYTIKEGKSSNFMRANLPIVLILASCLTCYSDLEANQWKFCDEDDGFNTCFATYDRSKFVL